MNDKIAVVNNPKVEQVGIQETTVKQSSIVKRFPIVLRFPMVVRTLSKEKSPG